MHTVAVEEFGGSTDIRDRGLTDAISGAPQVRDPSAVRFSTGPGAPGAHP